MAIIVKRLTKKTIFSLMAALGLLSAFLLKILFGGLTDVSRLGEKAGDVFGVNEANADTAGGGVEGGIEGGSGGISEGTCGDW